MAEKSYNDWLNETGNHFTAAFFTTDNPEYVMSAEAEHYKNEMLNQVETETQENVDDDIMPSYQSTYEKREEEKILSWGKPAQEPAPEVQDEIVEINNPYILKTGLALDSQLLDSAKKKIQTDVPFLDEELVAIEKYGLKNEYGLGDKEPKTLGERFDGFVREAGKAFEYIGRPFYAPFIKGSETENPIVKSLGLGSVDTANNLLGVARDLTNLAGGSFTKEDWLQIPQFIEENPDSGIESVGRFMTQFLAPFGLLGGFAKGATISKQVMAELGAIATFDPTQENFGAMLKDLGMEADILDYLAQPAGQDADVYERLVARAKTVFVETPLAFIGPAVVGGVRMAKEMGLGNTFKEWMQSSDPEIVQKTFKKFGVDIPQKDIFGKGKPTIDDPMIVQHNLTEAGVEIADDIGGIPMPSMAVSKVSDPVTKFGDISLVGDESLATPSARNLVYSADTYTGTQPTRVTAFKDIDEVANNIMKSDDIKHFSDAYMFDVSNTYIDKENTYRRLSRIEAMKAQGYKPSDYGSYKEMEAAFFKENPDVSRGYFHVDYQIDPNDLGETHEVFTREMPSGNIKHEPYTLENVHKEMTRNKAWNPATESGTIGSPTGRKRAQTASKFKSLAQVKKAREKIIPDEQFSELAQSVHEKEYRISEAIAKLPEIDKRTSGQWGFGHDLAHELMETVISGKSIKDYGFTEETTKELVEIIKPLKQMMENMSTHYFEIKPKDVKTLSDFKGAIVPHYAKEAKKLLKKSGIKKIYMYGNEEERKELFKKFPELMFAKVAIPTTGLVGTENADAKEPKIVRNVRNNNPGNIKDFGDKWVGMTGVDSGGDVAEGNFVVFDKPEHGVRALTRDLTNKRKGGYNTISKILHRYAPEGKENDTKAYIKDVATDVGISPNTVLKDADMFKLIKAITKHEGGKESLSHFKDSVIAEGMRLAYPKKYKKYVQQLLKDK